MEEGLDRDQETTLEAIPAIQARNEDLEQGGFSRRP